MCLRQKSGRIRRRVTLPQRLYNTYYPSRRTNVSRVHSMANRLRGDAQQPNVRTVGGPVQSKGLQANGRGGGVNFGRCACCVLCSIRFSTGSICIDLPRRRRRAPLLPRLGHNDFVPRRLGQHRAQQARNFGLVQGIRRKVESRAATLANIGRYNNNKRYDPR